MRYISTPKKLKKKKARYDTIKERAEAKFIKRQLINKNGAICAICGRAIKDMNDCTLDHIIPVSKGGLTTIDNCQLAHFKCNIEKGDSI